MQTYRVPAVLIFCMGVMLLIYRNGPGQQELMPRHSANGLLLAAAVADEKAEVRVAIADDDEEERSLAKFMLQKLGASNQILKGLMTEDMSLIADNADKLLDMSKEERWRASNDMMYLQHSTQFRNAVDDLRVKAEKNSIDGASLAWVNVTMSCIQCHQWVRNVVLADTTP